jgi:hypothetical protein
LNQWSKIVQLLQIQIHLIRKNHINNPKVL